MAADSLLAALINNYGNSDHQVDNTSTVRGLLSYCKKWPEGAVAAKDLNNPCLEMATRLREGASQMEESLRRNPGMRLESSSPIARTSQAYLAIAEVLEELPELARDEKLEEYVEDLELFEQERQAVLEAQEQIEVHLSGKVPLCPSCGSPGEEPSCSSCSLVRLYPDPKALPVDEEAAQLSGCYGNVYSAYRRVLLGESSLDELWNTLSELETHLQELLSARQHLLERLEKEASLQNSSETGVLEAVLTTVSSDIAMGLAGIERMRSGQQTQRVYDLSRGWDDIYHASQAIEVAASRILRTLGDEEE